MEWKALTVRLCADSGAPVVWYFDILEAEKDEISEEGMVERYKKSDIKNRATGP